MAAPTNIKSQGMKFAEELLQRHGWTEGKGLGKRENGISEAIKVKVKCGKAGVGHNSAEQFTFHWWDHVFNRTASSLAVEPDQDGVQVKKLTEDATTVSNKKPRKAMANSNMLYGRFIKSATLMSGGEKPVEEPSSSGSSEDEDAKLDLSSATKLTDEDLMKICGGRTAHKGARHGLTMSAKLSRIEEQERAFMEKYRKKEPSKSGLNSGDTGAGEKKKPRREEGDDVGAQDSSSKTLVSKKTKKKRNVEDGLNGHDEEHAPSTEEDNVTTSKKRNVEDGPSGHDEEHAPSTEEDKVTTSKKKKKRKPVDNEEMVLDGHEEEHGQSTEEDSLKPKKKKKRKTIDHEELVGDEVVLYGHEEEKGQPTEEDHVRPEKKKRRKAEADEEEQGQNPEQEEGKSKKKKKRRTVDHEVVEDEERTQSTEEEDAKITKKKKKKHKQQESSSAVEETEQTVESTEHRVKSKKKRKHQSE